MKTNDRDKTLINRNNKEDAFKKDQKEQAERDQLLMPVDDLPLEDIKYEEEEERDKKATKDRSSSDPDTRHRR